MISDTDDGHVIQTISFMQTKHQGIISLVDISRIYCSTYLSIHVSPACQTDSRDMIVLADKQESGHQASSIEISAAGTRENYYPEPTVIDRICRWSVGQLLPTISFASIHTGAYMQIVEHDQCMPCTILVTINRAIIINWIINKHMEKLRLITNPTRTNPLEKLHELEKSHRILNIPVRIDHPFRKRNARSVQTRNDLPVLVVESARDVVELGRQGRAVPRELRQRVPSEPYGVDDMRAGG